MREKDISLKGKCIGLKRTSAAVTVPWYLQGAPPELGIPRLIRFYKQETPPELKGVMKRLFARGTACIT